MMGTTVMNHPPASSVTSKTVTNTTVTGKK
jgi:hypothetical protein